MEFSSVSREKEQSVGKAGETAPEDTAGSMLKTLEDEGQLLWTEAQRGHLQARFGTACGARSQPTALPGGEGESLGEEAGQVTGHFHTLTCTLSSIQTKMTTRRPTATHGRKKAHGNIYRWSRYCSQLTRMPSKYNEYVLKYRANRVKK